ncbi:hypothetical protein BG003_010890 [Podila horticola]|nr:hypothetical protein BG003_010890 [Podila horticola]
MDEKLQQTKITLHQTKTKTQSVRQQAPPGFFLRQYYLNLVEPKDNIYCMCCCENEKDCDKSHSTYGCKALIKVGVDTETMPTDTETTFSFKPKPTKSSGDRTHFHSDSTHLVLYTPIIAKTTGPLNGKIRSSASNIPPADVTTTADLPSSDTIVPSTDVTATTIAVPITTSIRFPTEITAKTSDISNSCSQLHFQRLQRVKETLETYQLCARIARKAAAKKTTDTTLEKYRIEQEEKARLEEEAHKEKEREERVEREAENTKDTDDASDEYRKDHKRKEEVEREAQDQKTDDESEKYRERR